MPQVEYRLVEFEDGPRSKEPWIGRNPAWIVYAGSNGGILAFKLANTWYVQLRQTHVRKGYWRVTIPNRSRNPEDRKPMPFPVHQLVLLAWHGNPKPGEVGRHLDGNRNDNRPGNLGWGTRRKNAKETFEHRPMRASERAGFEGIEIALKCDGERWQCLATKVGIPFFADDGEGPWDLISAALHPPDDRSFRKPKTYLADLQGYLTHKVLLPLNATEIDAGRMKVLGYCIPRRFRMNQED